MAKKRPTGPSPGRQPAVAGHQLDILTPVGTKYATPLILLIMLGALALRASDLKADPPADLSWSTGPYTDEALNFYSARSMVRDGRWQTDDFFPFAIYPLANLVMVPVFRVFGFGLVTVKLLSLLTGLLSVWAVFSLVRERHGPVAGLIAALLLATCFPLVMYSRIGMVEPIQTFFLLLTGLFYVRGLTRPRDMLFSGLFATGNVLLVKLSSVFTVPAVAAMFVWDAALRRHDPAERRQLMRGLLFFLAGVGGALAVWLLAVYLPHRQDYFAYLLRVSFSQPAGHPQTLGSYLLNTFTVGAKSGLFPRLSYVALFGFVTLPLLGIGREPVTRYLFLWFLFGLLMFGYMNYRPDRYETIVIPVLAGACAVGARKWMESGTLIPTRRPSLPRSAALALWLWPLVTQLAFHTRGFWGALKPRTEAALLASTLLISAIAGLTVFAAPRVLRGGLGIRVPLVRTLVVLALLALSVRLDLTQYFGWYGSRRYEIASSSTELDRSLPEGAVVGGNWAPMLLVNSKKRPVYLPDWLDPGDPIGRFGLTHLVSIEDGYEAKLFQRIYPSLMSQAKVFREYEVRGIRLLVYELPRPDK